MRIDSPLRRSLAAASTVLLIATLAACGEEASSPSDGSAQDSTSAETSDAPEQDDTAAAPGSCEYVEDGTGTADLPPAEPAYEGEVEVDFSTTIGDFTATLDASAAPCTVNSVASLVDQGYFDGTTCHRLTVTQNFEVLQCGDPTATGEAGTGGTGGPGYTIPDEYDGSEVYTAGTLAMARTAAPNSGGSQFFIVYGDTLLPAEYTVFGTIDQAGIDAISQAAQAGVTPVMGPEDGAPKEQIDLTRVTLG